MTKPITLTFRLFGNLFSGGLMVRSCLALLARLRRAARCRCLADFRHRPPSGLIQAYIFMLLTIIYFGMATSHDEPEHVALEASH